MLGLLGVGGALLLLVAMLACTEFGRRLGLARLAAEPDGGTKGTSAAEGAVFALLGLLIAFTFSGAASRFEDRRHLISEEENAIGTAYLRVDLLPADAQPEIRRLFRRYVESRLDVYRDVLDTTATQAALGESQALQAQIWSKSVAALRRPDTPGPSTIMVVPALNEMFDITATRMMAARNHPPMAIFVLLVSLCLLAGVLIGYGAAGNRDRPWFHPVVFSVMLAATVYVIVDIEFPRVGLIRIDSADDVFVKLRDGMPE